MRSYGYIAKTVLLSFIVFAPGLHAEQGLLTFVFGPSSQEAARQSARAAAATARHWLQTDGGAVEIRRGGSLEGQAIDPAMAPKEIDQTFLDAVLASRETDPPTFLLTLDAAAQAAAMRPGARVVVAVLNSPSFSTDGERTLEHLTEVCQAHGVRILVLDVQDGPKPLPNAALNALATKSGGAWMRQAKDLAPQVAMVAPVDETTIPAVAPAPPAAGPAKDKGASATGAALPPFEIPVHARFMRTSGTGSTTESIGDHEADFGMTVTISQTTIGGSSVGAVGGGGSMEFAYWPNDPHAPLQGLVTVETPLTALRFDTDDTTGTYQGRARITVVVRDAKGVGIWNARKDVSLHGPLQKLAARREGGLFFMRGVTIVGQGPFTMEAKVEDLVGKTTGSFQTELRVGRNAPGLVATDALAVRPFRGSADAFEADQVLSYDGEALSPVLDPIFRADKPVDLQVYLRLYPDIHGAPLDLSMEVLNEGRVVARMALPFKGMLSSSAREGGFSGISGNSNIVGGQAREFPYLVNMKGAKFPAGDYQGIISIRQGNNVIRRVVPFKVVGNGPRVPVETASSHVNAPAEDAEAAVVLPDIEPASIDSSGLKMRDELQKQLWEAAAKVAMGYLDQLPNFRCVQETHRLTASAKTPDQTKEADSYLDELIFEDGKERYQRLESDGVKPDNSTIEDKGVSSRNEFGTLLRGVFDPDVSATYHWAGRSMALGVLCQVFEFEVSRQKSNFVLHSGNSVAAVAYTGHVFIDEELGMVRRLTIQGVGLAKDFGLQSPSLSLDYGMVKIGEKDYLLPLRSTLQLRQGKTFVRNEAVFRGYRKFQAESQIKFAK